jgi:hypothetical protein
MPAPPSSRLVQAGLVAWAAGRLEGQTMFRHKVPVPANRIIWRISAAQPAGVYVQTADPKRPRGPAAEHYGRGWQASTLELLDGIKVSEAPLDTLPGELIDEFVKPRR